MMLSLDFAEIDITEIMATTKIITAIVPNSGITKVPIISISSAPPGYWIVRVLSVEVAVSSNVTSSPSTRTKRHHLRY